MESTEKMITVSATVKLPVEKVWELWTMPQHIMHWNNASEDWHTTFAENDLKAGGKFLFRMEARDGSFGFDFNGVYNSVLKNKFIAYNIEGGRNVSIIFASEGNGTKITESFEPEETNPPEMQRTGWQSILNNFKKYAESRGDTEILHFESVVNCPPIKVYEYMLNEKKYREWTSVFNPSSRYEGSWEKGSKILFIGEDSNGNSGGMVSRIKENIPHRFISIEHLGILKNGEEINCGPEVDLWKGSLENYTFSSADGKTRLSVDIDSNSEFRTYFLETWPLALEKIRALCE
jgi:uncharacterized protein YndB with AHSA1/START domain